MGLAPIPIYVLNKLRGLTFAFLWGSSRDKHRYHLTSWEHFSCPKDSSGWGIKNLHWFSIALRLKFFWSALNSTGIWNLLLSAKYMRNLPVHTWLREKNFSPRNVSIIWKGFLKTLPWIGKGILWQVGNGTDVLIDVDPVVGMGNSFTLPANLRAYLADYGISTLEQARNNTSFAKGYWFTAEELDLCEEWKFHWESYIKGL